MTFSPTLTSGMRNVLFSLTDIQSSMDKTNYRLATGRKVNSALDNTLNFFTADGLNSRASALNQIQDTIALGVKVHQAADAALTSLKSLLDTAEGQIRSASQQTGQNNKAVTTFAFGSATDTFLDTGTDQTRLGTGDTLAIDIAWTDTTTGTVTVNASPISVDVSGTVQDAIDSINNNTTLNPAGEAPAIHAYLNDSNQLVIEAAGGDDKTMVLGFQLNVNASGGTDSLITDVFNYTGGSGKTVTYTGDASSAQTAVVESGFSASRLAAAVNFREVLSQITNTASDAGYNGTNLIYGDSLKIYFNEENTTSILTRGVRYDATGLGFTLDNSTNSTGDAFYAFQSDKELSFARDKIKAAKAMVEAQARVIGSNFTMIQNRLDYNKNVVKNLKEGTDLLTLADMNEEGATLASLQTRQQLSVASMSIANQADQAILRLF